MFNGQVKMLKFYLVKVLNRFLPGIKGAGLIIILPTCFVVIINFFLNLNETFTRDDNKVVKIEKKIAPLKKDLPIKAVVNYVTDQGDRGPFFSILDYAFVPIRIIRGREPQQDYLIVDYLDKTQTSLFKGYTLKRRYSNGIMLFERNN
jgi:hypothetical protein